MPNLPGTHLFCSSNPPPGATRALHFQGAVQQVRAEPLAPTWDRKQELQATRPSSFDSKELEKQRHLQQSQYGAGRARHVPAAQASAAQRDLPQLGHRRPRERGLPGARGEEPHLPGGARAQRLQPSRRQSFTQHHTPDLRRGGTSLLLPPPRGVRVAWVRLGERQIRNHKQLIPLTQKQLQHPLPQGPAASLPRSFSINSGPPENYMSRSFFQLHHTVIKRYGLSLSAQADLGYYRGDCTLLMNQGRELSK